MLLLIGNVSKLVLLNNSEVFFLFFFDRVIESLAVGVLISDLPRACNEKKKKNSYYQVCLCTFLACIYSSPSIYALRFT